MEFSYSSINESFYGMFSSTIIIRGPYFDKRIPACYYYLFLCQYVKKQKHYWKGSKQQGFCRSYACTVPFFKKNPFVNPFCKKIKSACTLFSISLSIMSKFWCNFHSIFRDNFPLKNENDKSFRCFAFLILGYTSRFCSTD